MKYNYYEIDGDKIWTVDGSIRDKAIHSSPIKQVDAVEFERR